MTSESMKILIVDDEADIRTSLQEIVEEEGYQVLCAATAAAALQCATGGIDLAIVDIKLGADNGMDLLRLLRAERPAMPVVMISGHGTVALTAEAFKLGAHDFMEKPLRLVQVRATLRNALESVRLKQRVAQHERDRVPTAVFGSEVMRTLYAQVARLAGLSEPVVIMGPSGSGKELVARSLHFDGPRAEGPFVATNAASMPVSLAEDELFGHEKGAFTGAHARRVGCIELADGGTLFLDEIGDMDPQIQAKILRVLETGQLTRLGSTKPTSINVRIVAATHKDLESAVSEGLFRHDLWYRLCAFVLRVPDLSARRDDIPVLAETLLKATCAEMGVDRVFTRDALEDLARRDYPGNIRELKHVVTRAAVFSDRKEIDKETVNRICPAGRAADQTPAADASTARYFAMDFRSARDTFERDYLAAALERHNGNITATAGAIGMAQSNLSRKLKELGLRG